MMTPELAALSAAIEAKIEDAIGVQPEGAGEALLEDGGPVMEFFEPALTYIGAKVRQDIKRWHPEIEVDAPYLVEKLARKHLGRRGITGPLADLCLRLSA